MTAARRLAAILAAGVVGYSRLMGEDEAGTARPTHMRARWTRRRPPWPEARRRNPELTVKWMIEHTPNLPHVQFGPTQSPNVPPGTTSLSRPR
jgi:hypothetical protein